MASLENLTDKQNHLLTQLSYNSHNEITKKGILNLLLRIPFFCPNARKT